MQCTYCRIQTLISVETLEHNIKVYNNNKLQILIGVT